MIALLLVVVVAVEAAFVARLHKWCGAKAVVRVAVLGTALIFTFVALFSVPHLLTRTAMVVAWAVAALALGGYLAYRLRDRFGEARDLPRKCWQAIRRTAAGFTLVEWVARIPGGDAAGAQVRLGDYALPTTSTRRVIT